MTLLKPEFRMPGRIEDSELRQRLEAHSYEVPPITDTTRSLLLKKLDNLDREYRRRNHQAPPRPGIDYSSAEEDFTPVASSTKKHVRPTAGSRARGRNGVSSHLQSSYRDSPSRAGGGGGGSKTPS